MDVNSNLRQRQGFPIFRSVHQALHVSYLMASLPVTQKGNTQSVLEWLMRDAGLPQAARAAGSINFSGLSPMEVRGQCAMVRGAVIHHCLPMERHAIHAWFVQRPDERGRTPGALDLYRLKVNGVLALVEHCAPRLTLQDEKARALVLWHVHSQGRARDICTERAIAAETGVSQSTIHRNIVTAAGASGLLRRAGIDRLEGLFRRDGLVEGADHSAIA